MPEVKPQEHFTESERVMMNALERTVETGAKHAIAVILSPDQMDVMCTSKLCHHQLSALFLALSQRHADFAAEVEEDRAKSNVEIIH